MNGLKGKISAIHFFGILFFFLANFQLNAQQGLKAEYFDGVDLNRLVDVRNVSNIDENWDRYPPVAGLDPHRCSIRWTGKIVPGKTGNYKFSARVDDGIRVWINKQLIIDEWELNDVGIFQNSIDMIANRAYNITVEYFNALNEGEIRLLWKIPNAEKSWYETIFGGEEAVVIAPEYFVQPDAPEPTRHEFSFWNVDEPVEAAPLVQPEITMPKKSKPIPKKKVEQPVATTITPPKVDTKKPVVTAKVVERFIPKNIAFEQAKIVILESSYEELNLFAQFMLDYPQLTVMIEGHTDPVGDAAMNLALSKQRAYKIANYLVDKGVNNNRIEAEGYGGSKPLVVPKEGSYYPANRRVVFIVGGWE